MRRRGALGGLLGGGALAATGWPLLAHGQAVAADAAASTSLVWEPEAVAPGIFRFPGTSEDVAPSNRGRVANAAAIVGERGVLVVNGGSSHRLGLALLAGLARVTDRPVVHAVLTQQAPEFVFGASALKAAGAALWAHARTAELIASQCHVCLARLQDTLGPAEMAGSVVTVPERTLTAVDTTIDLGGRSVRLHHPGPAASPGDLVVIDETSRTLITGNLACMGRVPQLRLEDYGGWIGALTALEDLAPRLVVPGFGPAGPPPGALARTREYLQSLDATVRRALQRGMSLSEARASVRLPRFETWQGMDTQHIDNVQRRYLALELG